MTLSSFLLDSHFCLKRKPPSSQTLLPNSQRLLEQYLSLDDHRNGNTPIQTILVTHVRHTIHHTLPSHPELVTLRCKELLVVVQSELVQHHGRDALPHVAQSLGPRREFKLLIIISLVPLRFGDGDTLLKGVPGDVFVGGWALIGCLLSLLGLGLRGSIWTWSLFWGWFTSATCSHPKGIYQWRRWEARKSTH